MKVESFFESRTSSLTYVVYDEATRVGVVIDSVLDFELATGRTWTESADSVLRFIEQERITVPYVLDTHAHADHVSAITYVTDRLGAKSAIGADIDKVQRTFRDRFNLGDDFPCDGRQFDLLLNDGEKLDIGPFELEAIHTPGHTSACMTYRIEDALFVGDVLFQPDYGTARCDFPGGSASDLFASIRRLYESFPEATRVFTGHDYQPGGRSVEFESTLREQRNTNVQLSDATSEEAFVNFRKQRDATLSAPRLMLPAIQLNIRAGEFPEPESNGTSFLKLPLSRLEPGIVPGE